MLRETVDFLTWLWGWIRCIAIIGFWSAFVVGFILTIVIGASITEKARAAPCEKLGGHYEAAGLGYPESCWGPGGLTRLFPED